MSTGGRCPLASIYEAVGIRIGRVLTQVKAISVSSGFDRSSHPNEPELQRRYPMRLFAMAALTAIGLGLAATSGAYAAPINATSIGKSASEMSPLTTVYYRRYYHRHGY